MAGWKDLLGTFQSTFRIGVGKATLDASAITAPRSHVLPDQSGTLALTSQLGGLTKGVAILDFGAAGSDVATVTVANTSVTATSQIIVDLNPIGTADNDADEHFAEPAAPRITARVAGVSFDISMASTDQTRLFGTWSIIWALVV